MNNNPNFYNPYPQQRPSGNRNLNGHAITSMILGICSIVFMWLWFIALACGIIGLVLGLKGRFSEKQGMAKAGIITSIIGLAMAVLVLIFSIAAFSLFS